MPSEQRTAAASQFVAAVDATMAAANCPVTMLRAVQLTSSLNRQVTHD